MLYSVQRYCKSLLDGLVLPPGIPGPLTAWITPPVTEKIKEPRAYVWGGRARGGRQTTPRGPGFKKLPWIVDVYLAYMDSPDDALQDEPFPQVIDTVISMFATTAMPLFIDSRGAPVGPNATAATDTQILGIGESWSLEYPPERMVVSQRQVWYSALISMDVLEVVQA